MIPALVKSKNYKHVVKLFDQGSTKNFSSQDLFAISVALVNVGRLNDAVKLQKKLFDKNRTNEIVGTTYARTLKLLRRYSRALQVYETLCKCSRSTFFEERLTLANLIDDSSKVTQLIHSGIEDYLELCVEHIYSYRLSHCCLFALKLARNSEVQRKYVLLAKILIIRRKHKMAHKLLKSYCVKNWHDDDACALFVKLCAEYNYQFLKNEMDEIVESSAQSFSNFGPNTLNDFAVNAQKHEDPSLVIKIFEIAGKKTNAPLETFLNLSDMLQKTHQYSKSESILNTAYNKFGANKKILAKISDYHIQVGSTLTALDYYRKMLAMSDDFEATLGLVKCHQDLAEQMIAQDLLSEKLNKHAELARFYLYNSHYVPDITTDVLLKRYKTVGKIMADQIGCSRDSWGPFNKEVIQVGIVSSDFYKHPTMNFLSGFTHLAKFKDVNVYLISNTRKNDDVTAYLKEKFGNRWIDISTTDTKKAVDLLRPLKLDIAIDLNGHTGNNRFDIFAQGIAFKQVATLGLMCTTGMPFFDTLMLPGNCIDAHISDEIVEDFVPFLSLIPFRSNLVVNEHVSNFNSQRLTMVSCSRLIRHSERLWKTWATIQKRTNATLVINCRDMRNQSVRQRTLEKLVTCGLQEELIELKYTSPISRAYDEADITLDTFPANSGTTLHESIICGKPFVTLNSVGFIGAIGEEILTKIGETGLVAYTVEEYVRLCVSLLLDKEYRRAFFSRRHEFNQKLADTKDFSVDLRKKLFEIVEIT